MFVKVFTVLSINRGGDILGKKISNHVFMLSDPVSISSLRKVDRLLWSTNNMM